MRNKLMTANMTLLILALLLLTACSAVTQVHDTDVEFQMDTFILQVQVLDDLHYKGEKVNGYAEWSNGLCSIKLDTKKYTHSCIGHEVRHCLEGSWHEGRDVGC